MFQCRNHINDSSTYYPFLALIITCLGRPPIISDQIQTNRSQSIISTCMNDHFCRLDIQRIVKNELPCPALPQLSYPSSLPCPACPQLSCPSSLPCPDLPQLPCPSSLPCVAPAGMSQLTAVLCLASAAMSKLTALPC